MYKVPFALNHAFDENVHNSVFGNYTNLRSVYKNKN